MQINFAMQALARAIVLCLLFVDPANAQGVELGIGSSVEHFKSHTLRLPELTENDYPLCGKKLRDVIPTQLLGNWTRIECQVADDLDGTKMLPILFKIVLEFFTDDTTAEFVTYKELKSSAVLDKLMIDSRIILSFNRNARNPLLGSEYVVINVDSKRKIAYLKHSDSVGLLKFDNPSKKELNTRSRQ